MMPTPRPARALLTMMAALLVVAACEGTPETRAKVATGTTCGAIGQLLTALAPLKARMSSGQIAIVDGVVKRSDEVCLPNGSIRPEATVANVALVIKTLRDIRREVINGR